MNHIMREKAVGLFLNSQSDIAPVGWRHQSVAPCTENNLASLFDDSIPAIILPGVLTKTECSAIVGNLKKMGMANYSHVNHAVGRMGLAQMEYHLKNDKPGYFQRIPEAQIAYQSAIAGSRDPICLLLSFLRHATTSEVAVAQEAGFGEMFAGTFRNVMTVGHKHFDFAPFEAKGWDISKIQSQLSWNLYLDQPVGGDLVVHERQYSPEDEALRVPGQYFYDDSITSGRNQFRYTPKIGDIVIFNSRNIHEVKPVTGDRFSLSSFIGRLHDGSLILWS